MRKYFKPSTVIIFFVGIFILYHSCKKEEPAKLPLLSTTPVTNVTATTAISGGFITSDGGAVITACGVCWGTSPNPITADSKTSENVSIGQFTSLISGLNPGKTYHVRAYAINVVGTAYGADLTFSTLGEVPAAVTMAATNVTETGATLNGTVNPNFLSTTVTFEYGTTTSYGQSINAIQSPVTGNSNTNVTANLTGLTAGTTYHFRVKAVNSVGTTYGDDQSFTTLYSALPTSGLVGYWPFTGNANDLSGNNYNGTVNGAVLTSDRFGRTGSAYSFDGVNDYIAIAPSSLVDYETQATLSFWLIRGADDDYGLPIHTGNQGRIQTSVSLNSVSVGVTTNSNYDGAAPSEFSVTDSFVQTQWNHIILKYDGGNKTLQLYINGELKKTTFAEGNIWAAQGCYLAFGVYYLFGTPHHGYYKGILDDVRLYKRALTDAEIQSLYHEDGW